MIAGATGVVGFAALKHFSQKAGWRVTAVSRRRPLETFGADFHSLDLTDARACADRVGSLGGVTRLVYAALYEKPGLVPGWLERDQIETNQRMLENLFEPLERASQDLRHVTLLQDTKAYLVAVLASTEHVRELAGGLEEFPEIWKRTQDFQAKVKGVLQKLVRPPSQPHPLDLRPGSPTAALAFAGG